MTYKVRINDITTTEKSKDDVIARLMVEFNSRTGTEVEVIWPDKSFILEKGFE